MGLSLGYLGLVCGGEFGVFRVSVGVSLGYLGLVCGGEFGVFRVSVWG